MPDVATPPPPLSRDDLKAALSDALRENRDWVREVVQEALEDLARDEARREAEYHAARRDPRIAFPAPEGHA